MASEIKPNDWVIDKNNISNSGNPMQVIQVKGEKAEVSYFRDREQEHIIEWLLLENIERR